MKKSIQLLVIPFVFILTACQADNQAQEGSPNQQSIEQQTTDSKLTMYDFPRLQQLDQPAPEAAIESHTAEYHGQTLSDDYHWLKDQGYPEVNDEAVINYLKAENAYYQEFLDPHKQLVDTVFEEFKGRTDEQETSVPYVDNGYEYRWYFEVGADLSLIHI